MTSLILTILKPVFWVTKTLFKEKNRFYVPLKMKEKCYCNSGEIYKDCHLKKDKTRGKTAYFVLQKNKTQHPKYILLSNHKKSRLQKIYASDERVKNTLGDVEYGAVYVMGELRKTIIPSSFALETDYDITFDEGAIDVD